MEIAGMSVEGTTKCGNLGMWAGLASVPGKHGPGRAAPWGCCRDSGYGIGMLGRTEVQG